MDSLPNYSYGAPLIDQDGNESAVKRKPYCNRKAKEDDSKPCVIVLKLFVIFFRQTSTSFLKSDLFVKD